MNPPGCGWLFCYGCDGPPSRSIRSPPPWAAPTELAAFFCGELATSKLNMSSYLFSSFLSPPLFESILLKSKSSISLALPPATPVANFSNPSPISKSSPFPSLSWTLLGAVCLRFLLSSSFLAVSFDSSMAFFNSSSASFLRDYLLDDP